MKNWSVEELKYWRIDVLKNWSVEEFEMMKNWMNEKNKSPEKVKWSVEELKCWMLKTWSAEELKCRRFRGLKN